MLRDAYKPGDAVEQVNVYWVHHYQHRTAHKARIMFAVFPRCATCGERVRYEPAFIDQDTLTAWLREDRDFSHAVGTSEDTR